MEKVNPALSHTNLKNAPETTRAPAENLSSTPLSFTEEVVVLVVPIHHVEPPPDVRAVLVHRGEPHAHPTGDLLRPGSAAAGALTCSLYSSNPQTQQHNGFDHFGSAIPVFKFGRYTGGDGGSDLSYAVNGRGWKGGSSHPEQEPPRNRIQ